MDHSMHHMAMDHSSKQCAMKMTLNFDTQNLCILFTWWRIDTPLAMVASCLVIFLMAISYEYLRGVSNNLQERYERKLRAMQNQEPESVSLQEHYDVTTSPRLLEETIEENISNPKIQPISKLPLSLLYGIQVFYSFLLMLIFMSYNVYIMLAVTLGAIVGHFIMSFSKPVSGVRSFACH